MSSRIFSFSVKETDTSAQKLVERVKIHTAQTGVKFSYAVMRGLKLYMAQEEIRIQLKESDNG